MIGDGSCSFTDLTLVYNNQFLVGSFTNLDCQSFITVINLETEQPEIMEPPFGKVENIWGVEVFESFAEGEP